MPIRRLFQIVEIMKKIVRCGANWKMYNIAYWLQPQKPNNESFVFCYNFLFLCLHTRIYYSILWLTRAGVGAFVYGCIDHDSQACQAGLSDHVVLLGPGAEPPQPHRSRSQLLLLTAEHLKTTILSLVIVLWGVTPFFDVSLYTYFLHFTSTMKLKLDHIYWLQLFLLNWLLLLRYVLNLSVVISTIQLCGINFLFFSFSFYKELILAIFTLIQFLRRQPSFYHAS